MFAKPLYLAAPLGTAFTAGDRPTAATLMY